MRWRVICTATQRHIDGWCSCGFTGYRTAAAREKAAEKPCPRCGCPVAVLGPAKHKW